MGIAERARKLMEPDPPKREEDMSEIIEKWEEQCIRMEDMGHGLPMIYRLIALRKLVIGVGKQHPEVWEGDMNSMKDKDKYEALIKKVKDYAKKKKLDKAANKPEAMDIGEVQEEMPWGYDEWHEMDEWDTPYGYDINAVDKGKGQRKGKSPIPWILV